MDRLKKGCAAVSDYNEEVGELIIWLKEFEPKLNISVQLDSTDPKEIKNLQGNLLYCYLYVLCCVIDVNQSGYEIIDLVRGYYGSPGSPKIRLM